jgi:rod shape determining protein RodA
MTPLFRKFLGLNWLLFANMVMLICFGVYAIYNASANRDGALAGVWSKQITYALAGLPAFFAAALLDYKWVRWGALPIYLLGIAGLFILEMYGVEVMGQKRLRLGGTLEFQPSQLAIAGGIFVLAVIFGDLQRWVRIFRYPSLRLLLAGIFAGIPAVLVLKDDFGSASVWGPVFCAMLLVGSIPFRYLIVLILSLLIVVPFAYFFGLKEYQQKRISTVIAMATNNMDKVNLQDEGWVPNFLQIAVASAGRDGKGPESKKAIAMGQNTIHRTFFPNEAINDFIFAVIAEEFGFVGSVALLAGMCLLFLQGLFVAFFARDQMGRLIVVGAVAMLFTHTFENAGMNIILTPITGLPMPFTSYGGTFLMVCMFLMGMIQSVWIHRNVSPVKKTPSGREIAEDEE